MKSIKNIQKTITKFNVKPRSEMRSKVLNEALEIQRNRKQQSTSGTYTWRLIMQSKTTKFAAAAVVIVGVVLGVVLGVMFLGKTVTPLYALEQSIEAMKNVIWMHTVQDVKLEGGKIGESWFSVTHGISAAKSEDGSSGITYYGKDEHYSYDPATETIIISVIDEGDILSRTNSYCEYFDNIIDILRGHDGTETKTTVEVRNGEKVIVVEVIVPKGEPLGSLGTEIWRFVMDEKSFLPIQMVAQGYKADGEFIEFLDAVFDYPSSGPMDIYQLGVPRTVKIIDKRPSISIEVKSIIENYEAARENDLSRYTALVLYTKSHDGGLEVAEEATIYYLDGNKHRSETLSPTWDIIESQRKGRLDLGPEMGDSLESMLNWWTNREHLSLRRAKMYNGEYRHLVVRNLNVTEFQDNDEKNTKSRAKNLKPPNINDRFGAGNSLRLRHDYPAITLIENEYSKQNGLICLQALEERYSGTTQGRKYKTLCYIDQDRDYVCIRFEEYFVQDERWEKEYKDAEHFLIKNPDASLEYTQMKVNEITEFGQSEDGKWYPKKIERRTTTQRENGRLQKRISTSTIYLDTDREFSEDIFDSDAFSKYLE